MQIYVTGRTLILIFRKENLFDFQIFLRQRKATHDYPILFFMSASVPHSVDDAVEICELSQWFITSITHLPLWSHCWPVWPRYRVFPQCKRSLISHGLELRRISTSKMLAGVYRRSPKTVGLRSPMCWTNWTREVSANFKDEKPFDSMLTWLLRTK